MSRLLRLVSCVVLLLVNFSHQYASAIEDASEGFSVTSEVDNAVVTIGDPVLFTLTVEHPPAVKILDYDLSRTLQYFEIKNKSEFKNKTEKGIREGIKVTLTSYELGEFVLEPSVITYALPSGDENSILSNKLYVSVESIHSEGEGGGDDIRGMKGVVPFSKRGLFIWLILLLALLMIFGYYLYRKNYKNNILRDSTTAELLSPHEEAQRAIQHLIDSDLIKREKIKHYYSRLTEIMKRYFERRFEFLALESTTDEVMKSIHQFDMEDKIKTLILTFLETSDLVKFAKYKPSPVEIIDNQNRAKKIIDTTKKEALSSEHGTVRSIK